MVIKDLKRLLTLITIQELTHRDIADAAGWSAHSYVSRLLRGEVKTLKIEPATMIARRLGVPVEDLFVTKVTSNAGHAGQRSASSRRQAA